MRVVLDTNILVSALITKGTPPDQLYQAWLRNDIEIVTSVAQLEEVIEVLARPKIRRYVDPVVSGDKRDMLALGHVDGIPIRSARDTLNIVIDSSLGDNP